MLLRSWQLKTTNLGVFVATVAIASQVMSSSTSKPIAFYDADKYEVWHDATRDEIQALRSNHT